VRSWSHTGHIDGLSNVLIACHEGSISLHSVAGRSPKSSTLGHSARVSRTDDPCERGTSTSVNCIGWSRLAPPSIFDVMTARVSWEKCRLDALILGPWPIGKRESP